MLIGIDVGGTNLVAAKVSDSGKILDKASIPVNRFASAEELCADIVRLARTVAKEDRIEAVGIGFPGLVDNNLGVVIQTPNMPFCNTPFRELFQKEWNIPVFMGNDANCAAIGEYWAGAAKDRHIAVMITLGTGIGGGLIVNGKLFAGSFNGGMEVGHMVIDPTGPICGCGRKGCFEQYASATALIRIAKEQMIGCKNSLLWHYCDGNIEGVQGITVFQAAQDGDPTAHKVLDVYIDYLAIGLANLINILQPEVICLGGGISNAQDDLFLIPLQERVKKYVFDKNAPLCIERATLGNDAGLVGAAMLCKSV